MRKPCAFNRNSYLIHVSDFEKLLVSEADIELKEFDYNPKDLALELAYTRYLLAKAEKELGKKLDFDESYPIRNKSGKRGREEVDVEIPNSDVVVKITSEGNGIMWEWKNIENIKLTFHRSEWPLHPRSEFSFEELREISLTSAYIVVEFFEPH